MGTQYLLLEDEEFEIEDETFAEELIEKKAFLLTNKNGDLIDPVDPEETDDDDEDVDDDADDEPEYYILNKDYAFTAEDVKGFILYL